MWVSAIQYGVSHACADCRFVLCKVCFANVEQVQLVALWQRAVEVVIFRYDCNVVNDEAAPHDVQKGTDERF